MNEEKVKAREQTNKCGGFSFLFFIYTFSAGVLKDHCDHDVIKRVLHYTMYVAGN